MTPSPQQRPTLTPLLLAVLALLSAFTPLSIDMYLPALPVIAVDLKGTAGDIQLTLSAFIIAFGAGQIFYGPAGDRFGRRPVILRAYGTAATLHRGETGWEELNALFPPDPGARQIFDVAVDLVQTSCGYAVPLMDFVAGRDTLGRRAAQRGEAGMPAYWREKNAVTIDGFPTGLPA